MTKNFQAFLKLDKSKLSNKYVVIIDSKVIGSGRDILKLLKKAKNKYPSKTPFIAKIPPRDMLII